MSLLSRIMGLFTSRKEPKQFHLEEYVDPLHEKMTLEHAKRQDAVISETLKALDEAEEFEVTEELIEPPPPDYDVGDVNSLDLFTADEQDVDHFSRNVVEHQSVDVLGDHLEHVGIIGDVPEEVDL